MTSKATPLVAHVIYRLAMGGLENGLLNLINHTPHQRYRHAIICVTHSTEFANRIENRNVPIFELNNKSGWNPAVHLRFWKLVRELKPAIIHTRNLPSMEFQVTAALAGVQGRVHGEHGRDVYDLDGQNFKYNILRKLVRPFVKRYIAVSVNLADWLLDTVGVRADRLTQIYNGVDTNIFSPRVEGKSGLGPNGFCSPSSFVIGTVGRMEPVKDQLTLVRAFLHVLRVDPNVKERLRLVMIGDGSLRKKAVQMLREGRADRLAWLPGEQNNIAELMRKMDLFVLPSVREGISNTILEAMATGLPVVATGVGGNPEIVDAGRTGELVPHGDPVSMAKAIHGYFRNSRKVLKHGTQGRYTAVTKFSIEAMVKSYLKTYDTVI